MVSEGRVYVDTKRHLSELGWRPLAGDPPRGTDLPPLEVKEPNVTHSRRKNANSVIFDLVFAHGGHLLLVECKDSGGKAPADVEKLRRVCGDAEWRASLLTALRSGPFLDGVDLDPAAVRSGAALVPCVAHPDDPDPTLAEFVQFRVDGGPVGTRVGDAVPTAVARAL